MSGVFTTTDMCHGFFKTVWESGHCPPLAPGARVLEIGSSEADWVQAMKGARPDLYIVATDQRGPTRTFADEWIQADLLDPATEFPAHSFEAIVGVSVIEWVGLGHYVTDRRDPEGDRLVMQKLHRWLKPTGWLYLDTPWDAVKHRMRPHMRAYSDASLQERLYQDLWTEVYRAHFEPAHPDAPYVAVLLTPRAA
jgi:hypothetical protein